MNGDIGHRFRVPNFANKTAVILQTNLREQNVSYHTFLRFSNPSR